MLDKRRVKGGKMMDAQMLRAAVGSQQMTTCLGVVRLFDGETSHYQVDTENGVNDVLVDVELIPSGTRASCRLGFGGDGIYRIPRVGSEVAVLIPYDSSSLIKDSLDGEPIIVAVLNTDAPTAMNVDDIIVLEATRVKVLSNNVAIGITPTDAVIKGNAFMSALNTLLTALNTFAASCTTTPPGTSAALATAVTTFQSTATNFLSTIATVG